jgi:hypothetical protein
MGNWWRHHFTIKECVWNVQTAVLDPNDWSCVSLFTLAAQAGIQVEAFYNVSIKYDLYGGE